MKIKDLFEAIKEPKDREYEIIKSNTAEVGEKVSMDFFLDRAGANVWIPLADPARSKLKQLKIGEMFSYANHDSGYQATVKRIK